MKSAQQQEVITSAEQYMLDNIPKTRPKDAYLRHVFGVRKYALQLAEKYDANKFVVEVAALLHDVGAYVGESHAEESYRLARESLSRFNIPKEFLDHILKCILTHSMGSITETKEQQIVQDADGIIFLEDTYRSYFEHKLQSSNLLEARELTLKKVKGMMDKIKTEEGKRIATPFLKRAIDKIPYLT